MEEVESQLTTSRKGKVLLAVYSLFSSALLLLLSGSHFRWWDKIPFEDTSREERGGQEEREV